MIRPSDFRSRALLLVLAAGLLSAPAVATAQPPNQTGPNQTTPAAAQSAQEREAVERETWRRELLTRPLPSNGCFTAVFPERAWRPEPCKPATPHRASLPNTGPITRVDLVGGNGPDFIATPATGHIGVSEGSFDTATGITSTDSYELQLNTDFFKTTVCPGGVSDPSCRGWEQFIYTSDGSAYIQYWFIKYGPSGTLCPTPRHTGCDGLVHSDGWCPFDLGNGFVYCAIDAGSEPSGVVSRPLSSLASLKLAGATASGGSNDAITFTDSGTPHAATGDNRFPDFGSEWQQAEFNVFGNGGNKTVTFNSGANVRVRTQVLSGTNIGPNCSLGSFTGESNNLTLSNTPPGSPSPTPGEVLVFDAAPQTHQLARVESLGYRGRVVAGMNRGC